MATGSSAVTKVGMAGGTAVLAIQNDWQSGFTGQVTITNTGSSTTNGWQIELDTLGTLTASWNGTVVSQSAGKYVITNATWNGQIAPGASVTFGFNLNRNPASPGITVALDSIGGTPPPAPLPTVQAGNAKVTEGTAANLPLSFDVRLSAASSSPVTVSFATVNGSALAGRDYDAASGTLTFAPGQTSRTVTINTHPSTTSSGTAGSDLSFGLALSNASGATVAGGNATGEIVTPAAATPTPTPGPVAGNLVVYVSEDAWQGDAKFTVSVDGTAVGGTYTASASHAAGQSGAVALPGTFAAGPHSVAVTFINDAYGGSGSTDRNLYFDAVAFNGTRTSVAAPLYSNGTASVTVGAAATPTPSPTPSSGRLQFLGVNLSGAEFGISDPNDGNYRIGTYGTDYTYPTHAEIDYYASQKLNIIRLPFSWERLQPTENGPLDKTQLGYIDDIVRYAATKGLSVVLDPHNYGYGYGSLIGSAATPDSAFNSLWSQLAAHYASQPNVIFGLMNEPHVQTPAQWVQPVNDAIAAIRATGATQEILVPGTAYDGGASWISSGNASLFAANVRDPGHNMAFEIHQYSDGDGSGSSASVVSPTIGADRLKDVTAWAEQTGNKLFLGEFGAGSDQASLTNLHNMLDFMQQHAGVWQGGTEWGGGPWWGNYFFATDPSNGTSMPQVAMLSSYRG